MNADGSDQHRLTAGMADRAVPGVAAEGSPPPLTVRHRSLLVAQGRLHGPGVALSGSAHDQPRSGTTSPMNRSNVSTSYGAGCSEMIVRKPSSTSPEPICDLFRCLPERRVVGDLRLAESRCRRSPPSRRGRPRLRCRGWSSLQPSVKSISAMSRPTASQWPFRTSTLWGHLLHRSRGRSTCPRTATVRSVLCSPCRRS